MQSSRSNTLRLSLGLIGCILALLLFTQQVSASKHPYFSKHPQQEQKLEALLKAAGIYAPAKQAFDFSIQLPTPNGKSQSLEQYQGKVLVLTRWATWCGACRAELPIKLQLEQAIGSPHFALLGISSEDKDTVLGYQNQNKMFYARSYLDPQNQLSGLFPGGSIPATLIVDGWGWIVGFRKGGAKWTAKPYTDLFRFLLSIRPKKNVFKDVVPAPNVSFNKELKGKPGQVIEKIVTVQWDGESDKYNRISIQFPKSKRYKILSVRADTGAPGTTRNNIRRYIYRFAIQSSGSQSIKGIKLHYWLKDYDKAQQIDLGELRVMGLQTTLREKISGPKASDKKLWAWGALGLGVLLFLVLIISAASKKKKSKILSPQRSHEERRKQRVDLLLNSLERLLSYHEKADNLAFTEEILWIQTEILEREAPELEKLCEKIRYANYEPPKDELHQWLYQLRSDLRQDYPKEAEQITPIL